MNPRKKPHLAYRAHSDKRRPGDAHTVKSFCETHGFSESFYRSMKKKGLGPDEIVVGRRIIITAEAVADWRARRQAETAKQQLAAAS